MNDRKTMDLAERRAADRELATQRADARRDYERTRARVFAEQKSKGASDRAAELACRDAAADAKHKRDLAHSLARSALLRINEVERKSVTVRDIHATSERIDGLAA